MELLTDPRVIGALIALIGVFLGSFIAPSFRDLLKDEKARKNLFSLIFEDIRERAQHLDDYIPAFDEALMRVKSDEKYMPFIFEIEGESNYIDWVSEKWLLPPDLAAKVLKVYNDKRTISTFIEFINTARYLELSRERQIKTLEILLEYMKKSRDYNHQLLPLLEPQRTGMNWRGRIANCLFGRAYN